MRCILFLLLVLVIAGCTLNPDYDQPPLDAPEDWRLIDHDSRDLSDCGGGDHGEALMAHPLRCPGCSPTVGGPEAAQPDLFHC